MKEATRRAYLQALDIPVWTRKEFADADSAPAAGGLQLGPGNGRVLLVCSAVDEPASRIAADISRALGAEPVWAWPGAADAGSSLADLVSEKLFTAVLIFGRSLSDALLGRGAPDTVGAAQILVAPGLDELANQPPARRSLWKLIREGGLVQPSCSR